VSSQNSSLGKLLTTWFDHNEQLHGNTLHPSNNRIGKALVRGQFQYLTCAAKRVVISACVHDAQKAHRQPDPGGASHPAARPGDVIVQHPQSPFHHPY